MTRVRPTLGRLAHAFALALAVLAVALSLRGSTLVLPLMIVAVATLVSPFVEWTPVPDSLRRTLPRVHALVLLTAGLVAWLSRSMSVLLLEPESIPLVAAPLLLPMWAAFALAPRAFPAGRTLVPAVIAGLAFAGLNPAPEGYGASVLPFPRDGMRNGFGEVYLLLALLATGALWIAALATRGPRWSRRNLVAVGVSTLLSVGLAGAAILGLPLAQPHVERAFAEALDQGTTGLSGQTALGEIGGLSVSRRRVLDLQASLPSGGQWRLPSEVFTRFDGRTWSNPAPPPGTGDGSLPPLLPGAAPSTAGPVVSGLGPWFAVPEAGGPVAAPPPGPTLELRITQAEITRWPLLLPRHPAAVTAQATHLDRDRFGLIRRPHGLPLRQYGAVVEGVAPSGRVTPGDAGSQGPVELTPDEHERSLALPATVDPRIVSLAQALAPASALRREKIDATVRHLQTHYRYSLAPGPFRADGDPLAEFLFEKKEAWCEYFATAAVVLLRLQGVPARYVKGLSVGPQTDMGGGLHVVRESDAHAWIEAWTPDQGWVEADPTPPGQFAAARAVPGPLRRSLEHVRAWAAGAWARLVEAGPLSFVRWLGGELVALAGRAYREPVLRVVIVLALLAPVAWRRIRRVLRGRQRERHRDGARHVPADLRALVRDLERRWTAHGRPRPAARGLLEHASVLGAPPPHGAEPVPLHLVEAGREIVDTYYAARFGEGPPPGAEGLRRLRARLEG